MKITAKLKKAIRSHAEKCFPRECCGVVVNDQYIACRNIAQNDHQFEIHHKDLAKAEDVGEIQAYVHSHPNASAQASDLDLHQIELHEKPWVICAYPDLEFQIYEPFGYRAPLVGRNYHHGWQDCYSIVRDFYQRELGIQLIDFERQDRWWESVENESLYLENFSKAGFVEVSDMQYGDVLLCKVGRTEHVNHAVIWLGDNGKLKSEQAEPCIGSALILHHPYGRKSVREIFGQQWQERVVKVVRHAQNN
ncbi:Mov34/MPN/PAD-1 family protein [Acinetobacter sp. 251-1]|uniref:C40 family peptidase n=1 Tax=Acinetobacter sp. 251-1 TaxID=2746720 RepID=UPI0025770AB7|nr:Mov34/MPN/PAD-1 family protein [Acinetobacter sp. 251-1]MDM1760711.1 C40 family peptidase [Acinetobacter sp. 251-1]